MNSLIYRIISYLRYRLKAGNAHDIHSPFVFELYTKIIAAQKSFYAFEAIEQLRYDLCASAEIIEVRDEGAGKNRNNKRSIGQIARSSAKSPATGELLFKLVDRFQPNTMIELGTSLGISTLYQASAKKGATFYTLEACTNTAAKAQQHLEMLGLKNVQIIQGNIDNTLVETLAKIDRVDYVFFDANHRYEPTMRYFELCLSKSDEESLFVFDDIHWSEEMSKAWNDICNDARTVVTIDLYDVGLVFFRKKQPKQHFILQF